VRGKSPNAALNCINCLTAPGANSPVATEPLQIAFSGSPPTSVVSAQVRAQKSLHCHYRLDACLTAFAANSPVVTKSSCRLHLMTVHLLCLESLSMQVASTFALALEDYYRAIVSATSGSTCAINSFSAEYLANAIVEFWKSFACRWPVTFLWHWKFAMEPLWVRSAATHARLTHQQQISCCVSQI